VCLAFRQALLPEIGGDIVFVEDELPLVVDEERADVGDLEVLAGLCVVEDAAEVDAARLQVEVGEEDVAGEGDLVAVLVLSVADGELAVGGLVVSVLLEGGREEDGDVEGLAGGYAHQQLRCGRACLFVEEEKGLAERHLGGHV